MKKAVYCGYGWSDNIGNAFIDYGIQHEIRTACPELRLYGVSNTGAYLKSRYTKRFPYNLFNPSSEASDFDLRTLIQADFVVMGGSLLTKYWLDFNKSFIDFLRSSGTGVVLLGAGGGNVYDQQHTTAVRDVLKSINFHALISRDEPTFERYHDLANIAHNGIDNAFFLSEAFVPMTLRETGFTTVVFDNIPTPKDLPIGADEKVIKTFHSPSWLGRAAYLVKRPLDMLKLAGRHHLISDHPDDYLHIYANAARTFSDRVHACVATLVFGGEAQLFTESNRSYLFERAGLGGVKDGLIRLEPDSLKTDKAKQLEVIREVFA